MLQNKRNICAGLKEDDLVEIQRMDMDGKNYLVKGGRHFTEDFGLETRVLRYHNVYGPEGTYDGEEKAAAAICRKIANAKLNKKLN